MIQLTLTLKMAAAQVVEMSVTVSNSPIQDYVTRTIILNLLMKLMGSNLSQREGSKFHNRKEDSLRF